MTATITSSGSQLPDRGLPVLDVGDAGADGTEDDLLARGAQRDGRGDLLRAVHVLQIDPAALLIADARRVDGLGRVEVGAVVQAAEEPLEQRRLPHDDVDEVDAAAGRVLAARDGDEWRDRMSRVGEEHVLAGRDDQQRERGREQHEPERQDAAGSQPALHSSDREIAAVDLHGRPGHVRGPGGGEEADDVAELARRAHAPDRDLGELRRPAGPSAP